jgi:vesicle transport through interaction with t-SNAREs protein 1
MESLIARSGSRLNDTRRILADTTDLGAGVLSDLDAQRRQLEGSQTKLREADSNVAMAVAVMKRMKARALRNKITLAFIVLMLLATIGFLIFELLDPTSSPTVETEESADQPPPPSPPGP